MLSVSDSWTERQMERFGSVKNAILIYDELCVAIRRGHRHGNGEATAVQRRTITLRGNLSRGDGI